MMAERQNFEDLRIVIEHFLKMRHEPLHVRRIARIAAAEMIVDAAFRHLGHRQFDEIAIRLSPQPRARPPEQFENGRIRKFRGAVKTAGNGVDDRDYFRREIIQVREAKAAIAAARRRF